MSEDNTDTTNKDTNESKKQMALSSKSKWLEGYSMLLSNGFKREVTKVWKRDGLTFTSNKEATKYLKTLIEDN